MSVFSLELKTTKDDVESTLARLDTALSPEALAGFLELQVGPYLQRRSKQRFQSEGDDASGKWAPLLPATAAVRAAGPWGVGADHPINKRTGELEEYITGSSSLSWPHSLGATLQFPGKRAETNSLQEKMNTAQKGRAKPATVPRPVLAVNERDLAFVMTELSFHVTGYVSSGFPIAVSV